MKAPIEDRTPRSSGETEEKKNRHTEGGKQGDRGEKGKTDRKRETKIRHGQTGNIDYGVISQLHFQTKVPMAITLIKRNTDGCKL